MLVVIIVRMELMYSHTIVLGLMLILTIIIAIDRLHIATAMVTMIPITAVVLIPLTGMFHPIQITIIITDIIATDTATKLLLLS